MSVANTALLLGYLLAVPFTVFVPGFLRLWRRRELGVFLVAQSGALLIALGWLVRGARAAALLNALWLVGLTAAWLREGRRAALRSPPARP